MKRTLHIIHLGRCDYDRALERQWELHAEAAADPTRAFLIFVEHPPVITLGRRADPKHVLYTPEKLAEMGVQLRHVDRGGDVTYHGPGQLVAYPILQLVDHERDVHAYFRTLEQCVIDLLADYGIPAGRHPGLTGVWIGDDKICAMGVAIKRWTTYHGLALNVHPDLRHFRLITPCGIADKGISSIARLTGRIIPLDQVAQDLATHFTRHFPFDEVTS